jgi:carbon monoxide dehydrogenase subunit G
VRIETGFDISRPPADTYALLLDLERVMPCFPGAELLARRPDGARDLRVTVRLGPMRLSYQGDVRIAERDDPARRAVLAGNARETRGGGSANARIAMRVEENERGARVVAEADVDITGRAAQMGRGIVEDVATRLVGEMAACLEAGLAGDVPGGGGPPAPLEGGRLILGAARDRARDPWTLAALATALALLMLLFMGIRRGRRDA